MVITMNFLIVSSNVKNPNKMLKNGLLTIGIFISTVAGYGLSLSIPPIFAQVIPKEVHPNDNITTNSRSDTTTTHTSYTIEGSKALLNSKLPLIKKAVVSQIYSAMGLTQKAGANNTETNLNALIINEIDNSTSRSSSLETTKSLAGTQVTNATATDSFPLGWHTKYWASNEEDST